MSDVMLLGVLRMPMPESPDPTTLRQFVSRARQAACRIEADADELEALRAEVARLKEHAVVLANTERHVERERWTEAVMAELDGNGQAQAIVAYATRA
jgi:hypothetical protein